MRTLAYEIIPAVGAGTIPKEGRLAALFDAIPYTFSTSRIIPPRDVLNDLFRTGIRDAGMSGGAKWEPFEICDDEYKELVAELRSRTEKGWRSIEVPSWVKTLADWQIWTFEFDAGVPSATHCQLSREEKKWATLKKNAELDGDKKVVEECHLKWMEAANALTDFITPYLKKHREKKNRG